jgi:hypothetical protein
MPGGHGFNWFEVELTSDYVDPGEPPVPEPEPAVVGGEQPYIAAGGWQHEFETRFKGRVRLGKVFASRAPGIARTEAQFEQRASGQAGLEAEFEARVAAVKLPAERWQQLLREDEEIVLSIV